MVIEDLAAAEATESDRPGRGIPRRSWWNVVALGAPVLAYGALVWHRRWMSDDGLIVLRTVRHLLDGAGPVFNVGERVEANTSTLWTAILSLPGLVPGLSLNWASVVTGLLLSVAGVAFGLDAARRLFGAPHRMVPFGALVIVALPPFWDFGTSGLETGLIFGWAGLGWWLLVRRVGAHGAGRAWPAALVLGLAPLVRPDLALVGLVMLLALAVLEVRRGWWRLVGLAAVAGAVPAAYEVFRAGYYGLLVPSTALAKEAGIPRWRQGGYYLADLFDAYQLWVPMAVLVVAALTLVSTRTAGSRVAPAVVAAAPALAAVLLAVYVTRVGGDFMHGRMLLPAVFCLALPLMAVPLVRPAVPVAVVMVVWSAVCLVGLRPAYEGLGPNWIANERLYYVGMLGSPHPITAADYATHPVVPDGIAQMVADPRPVLALRGPGDRWWLFPLSGANRDTIVWLNLGVAGELAPANARVLDGVGLVNPIAAHATGVVGGRIGHDKDLPPDWTAADVGVPGDLGFLDPARVAAARSALACPRTRDVLDSVRAPLTANRFWANLTGAWDRTDYRYPGDPVQAADCRTV